eukprot:5346694-Pyramimonas_sp.AAC.1
MTTPMTTASRDDDDDDDDDHYASEPVSCECNLAQPAHAWRASAICSAHTACSLSARRMISCATIMNAVTGEALWKHLPPPQSPIPLLSHIFRYSLRPPGDAMHRRCVGPAAPSASGMRCDASATQP